jgi:hypothetical protein
MYAVTEAAENLSVVLSYGQFKWIRRAEEFKDQKAKFVCFPHFSHTHLKERTAIY